MPKTATRVDRKNAIIRDVLVLSAESVNGNIYSDPAMGDVIEIINSGNGWLVNLGHKNGSGKYLAGLGKVFDAYRGSDGRVRVRELRLKKKHPHTEMILDDAESDDFNDTLALSIEVLGSKNYESHTDNRGRRVVDTIHKMNPLALVQDGGTNDGLFEENQNEDFEPMKINTPAELRTAFPEFVGVIEDETRTKYAAEKEESFAAETKSLKDEIEQLKEDLVLAKAARDIEAAKVKEFEDATKTDEKVDAIKAKACECGVPAGAISEERFVELAECSDDLVEEVLDQYAGNKSNKGYGGGLPKGKYTKSKNATRAVFDKHRKN